MREYRLAHPRLAVFRSDLLRRLDSFTSDSERPVAYHVYVQVETFPVAKHEALRQLVLFHHDLAEIAGIVYMFMQRCRVAALVGSVEEELHRIEFDVFCSVKLLIFSQLGDLFRKIFI